MTQTTTGTTPIVSIVIPVYNLWSYTFKCLMAIRRNTAEIPYEVIVVDDGSSDETVEALPRIEGVRWLRNPHNLGFAKTCNRGAAIASGKHVLFLNNDTEVQPGWLEPLVRVLELRPDVAIAGSKLLFPDGTIQHAGVAFAYGVFDPIMPFHVNYRQPRTAASERVEMRAVTAACMLIRADVLREVGGFDEGFVNSYEDVDLCLKVWAAGHKIVYEPASVVIHHESLSDGRFKAVGTSCERLASRWVGKFDLFEQDFRRRMRPPDPPADRPGVSVVVVTHDSLPTITACLENARHGIAAEDEIIVVDDGSRGATAKVVDVFAARHPDRVRVARTDHRLGFGRAAAAGLAAATRPYVALFGTTQKLVPGTLDRLVGHLQANRAIGLVSPTELDGRTLSDEQMAWPRRPGETLPGERSAGVPGRVREVERVPARFLVGERSLVTQLCAADPEAFDVAGGPTRLASALRERGRVLGAAEDAISYRLHWTTPVAIDAIQAGYLRLVEANLARERAYRGTAGPRSGGQPSAQEAPTSIVVVVPRGCDTLGECLRALDARTPWPLELVLVDDASGFDVAGEAERLGAAGRRLIVLRNDTPLGFAGSVNRGLAAASGRFIALLKPDVMVTEGWLARLLALLCFDDKVGLVGPMINGAPSPQSVLTPRFTDEQHLADFAAQWTDEHLCELVDVPRLAGACLLMKRQVVDRIGGLDTSFGAAGGEVEDLCIRAFGAGFLGLVCGDTLVENRGRLPTHGLDLNPRKSPSPGWRLLCHKWRQDAAQPSYDRLAAMLRAQSPFERGRDHVPLTFEEVFNPAAPPLSVGTDKPVRLLAIPDWEATDWRMPLADFLRSFGPDDPVALILRIDPPTALEIQRAMTALQGLLWELGQSADATADVVIEATELPYSRRAALYTAATALLPCGGRRAPVFEREAAACGLPVVDARREVLRDLAIRDVPERAAS